MIRGLPLIVIFLFNLALAQPLKQNGSTLSAGPWFKKKIAATATRPKTERDSSVIFLHLADIETLQLQTKGLASASDTTWQDFVETYQSLVNELEGNEVVESYLISDSFLHRTVMQANRSRRIEFSLYFIEEAKRIHPEGIYGSSPNCKH